MLKRARAFTLVEMMVTAAIIITLGVALMIRFSNKATQVTSSASRLRSDLNYIKFLAQTKNQRTRVNFSAAQYTFTNQAGSTAIRTPNGTTNVVTLPTGVTLSQSGLPSGYVVFDALGRPYSDSATPGTLLSSNATITLTSGSNTAQVIIVSETGEIQ